MAIWRAEIQKLANGKRFSNDYVFDLPTLADAVAAAQMWANFEKARMQNIVLFENIRVSSGIVGDRIFTHVPLNVQGSVVDQAGNILPAFNCVRVDFATANSDPGRKYYRYMVGEGTQDNTVIAAALIGVIGSSISEHVPTASVGWTGLRIGKLLRPVTGFTIYPRIQERQERRRRRKKAVSAGTV